MLLLFFASAKFSFLFCCEASGRLPRIAHASKCCPCDCTKLLVLPVCVLCVLCVLLFVARLCPPKKRILSNAKYSTDSQDFVLRVCYASFA